MWPPPLCNLPVGMPPASCGLPPSTQHIAQKKQGRPDGRPYAVLPGIFAPNRYTSALLPAGGETYYPLLFGR